MSVSDQKASGTIFFSIRKPFRTRRLLQIETSKIRASLSRRHSALQALESMNVLPPTGAKQINRIFVVWGRG